MFFYDGVLRIVWMRYGLKNQFLKKPTALVYLHSPTLSSADYHYLFAFWVEDLVQNRAKGRLSAPTRYSKRCYLAAGCGSRILFGDTNSKASVVGKMVSLPRVPSSKEVTAWRGWVHLPWSGRSYDRLFSFPAPQKSDVSVTPRCRNYVILCWNLNECCRSLH